MLLESQLKNKKQKLTMDYNLEYKLNECRIVLEDCRDEVVKHKRMRVLSDSEDDDICSAASSR